MTHHDTIKAALEAVCNEPFSVGLTIREREAIDLCAIALAALPLYRNEVLEEAAQRIKRLGYFMQGSGNSIRAQGAKAIRDLKTPEPKEPSE